MPFLFLLLALVAGAFVGWMSVLAAIWFLMPIFIIGAAIVSKALGNQFRWRLAAFSVGLLAVFALQMNSFVHEINLKQQEAQLRLQQERLKKQK